MKRDKLRGWGELRVEDEEDSGDARVHVVVARAGSALYKPAQAGEGVFG